MSPRPTLALLVALCCVLAGATVIDAPRRDATGFDGAETTGAEATAAETAAAGALNAKLGLAPAARAGVPVPARESPWGDDEIAVALVVPGDADGRYAAAARAAAAFWSANARRYLGYEADLRVTTVVHEGRADAVSWGGRPDVIVRVVDSVGPCAATNPVGCAPVVRRGPVERPVAVRVRADLDRASAERVLRHEFGHVLGLGHRDAPAWVMRPAMTVTTVPRPNATDRTFPWSDRTLAVYVDVADADDPVRARRAIDRALGYVGDAPGLPAVRFRRVDAPADAEVVIRVERTADPGDRCACYSLTGPDPDADGAIEEYRRLTLTLRDLPPATLAWHAGDRLSFALGAEARAERPPPFRRADPVARRAGGWGR